MFKLIAILIVAVAAAIGTALFLRRNKKIAAQVDAAATKAGAAIDKATGGKL